VGSSKFRTFAPISAPLLIGSSGSSEISHRRAKLRGERAPGREELREGLNSGERRLREEGSSGEGWAPRGPLIGEWSSRESQAWLRRI